MISLGTACLISLHKCIDDVSKVSLLKFKLARSNLLGDVDKNISKNPFFCRSANIELFASIHFRFSPTWRREEVHISLRVASPETEKSGLGFLFLLYVNVTAVSALHEALGAHGVGLADRGQDGVDEEDKSYLHEEQRHRTQTLRIIVLSGEVRSCGVDRKLLDKSEMCGAERQCG